MQNAILLLIFLSNKYCQTGIGVTHSALPALSFAEKQIASSQRTVLLLLHYCETTFSPATHQLMYRKD